jgi:tRNA threonylcarbamoyladenosine biosynthesis protein TsaB
MALYLGIQNTYQIVELALFNDQELVDFVQEDKTRASTYFVSMLGTLLNTHHISWADLSFIAVNQGPGPFTTLRVVIASVNGLSFATKIPLIGIDALDALIFEYQNAQYPITIALLNAFSHDVYFAIERPESKHIEKGYENITHFLNRIKQSMPAEQPIHFIGNATEMYKQEITTIFGDQAFIPIELPQTASIKQIGLMGFKAWNQKIGLTDQLMPLYLKQTSAILGK